MNDVETFISDYNAGDYVKMAEDAVAVLREAETILKDC